MPFRRFRRKRQPRDRGRQSGFTLLELLVVLAVLGLVAALVGPRLIGVLDRAKGDVAKVQIETLSTAMKVFRLDVGRYPTATEGLVALQTRPSGLDAWNGPYIEGGARRPWRRPYLYEVPGKDGSPYRIVSLGGDGQPGGEGDAADVAGP